MALNIRNRQAEELAEALTRLTGETKTQAVTKALQDRLDRLRRHRSGRSLAAELDDLALHCASLPVLDDRNPEEILRYDDTGVPDLMVIDTSALVAILQDEPERRSFNQAIEAAERRSMSAGLVRRSCP